MSKRAGGVKPSRAGPDDDEVLIWLHISDTHFSRERTGWDADRVVQMLLEDLRRLGAAGLRPDLIFFTGDLAFGETPHSSMQDQYAEGKAFLDAVRKAFSPEIEKSRVFLVPGNHDVNRMRIAEQDTAWTQALSKSPAGADIVSRMMHENSLSWRRYMERLQDYAAFLQRSGYRCLGLDEERLLFAGVYSLKAFRVGIAGLNTAWSCSNEDEKGRLWLGRWQIEEAYTRVRDADFSIVLTHHPANWMTQEEDPELGRLLENSFQFHLHGHEHQGWVDAGPRHVRFAAGACYEDSRKENGYTIVRLYPRRGGIEAFFRRYDRVGGGWTPRAIHGKTDADGRWTLTATWLNRELQEFVDARTKDAIEEYSISSLPDRLAQPAAPAQFDLRGVPRRRLAPAPEDEAPEGRKRKRKVSKKRPRKRA